jgi:putative flavoprotein involved in K+ transport
VVVERGEVGNAWRTQRWDALRLLTPNWLSALPGFAYDGDDPDGFMTMPEVVEFVERYSSAVDAPVRTGTTVTDVRSVDGGYRVTTDDGVWQAPTVMLASGGFGLPAVPALAAGVPDSVAVISPLDYRRPDELPPGGVLVVGASATGIQLADEIHRSGRPVTLSVGEHGAGTADATSCGGCRWQASWTSATTRSTTSCAAATSRHPSSWELPTTPLST